MNRSRPDPDPAPAAPRRIVRGPLHALLLVLALLLTAEEWLWDHLQAAMRRWRRHAAVRAIEDRIRQLPPWPSVALLGLPALLIVPFKVAAVWAMVHGHPWLGLLVLVGAKLAGTAAAAYLVDLVRDRARELPWFDALWRRTTALLRFARLWVRQRPGVRRALATCRWMRRQWRRWRGGPSRLARKLRAARVVGRRWRCCLAGG